MFDKALKAIEESMKKSVVVLPLAIVALPTHSIKKLSSFLEISGKPRSILILTHLVKEVIEYICRQRDTKR